MSSVDLDAGFAAWRNADPDVMDRDGLAELIRQLAAMDRTPNGVRSNPHADEPQRLVA